MVKLLNLKWLSMGTASAGPVGTTAAMVLMTMHRPHAVDWLTLWKVTTILLNILCFRCLFQIITGCAAQTLLFATLLQWIYWYHWTFCSEQPWSCFITLLSFNCTGCLSFTGDEVQVLSVWSSDYTPLIESSAYYHGFTGFRLWTNSICWL